MNRILNVCEAAAISQILHEPPNVQGFRFRGRRGCSQESTNPLEKGKCERQGAVGGKRRIFNFFESVPIRASASL